MITLALSPSSSAHGTRPAGLCCSPRGRGWRGRRRGYPTGVAYRGGGFTTRVDGPADATRVVNLTRHVVANIRPAPCLRVGQSPTVGLQASNGQFVGAHYAGGGPVTADREALEPWAGFHFEDENGGCVDAGDVVSLRTQHGFYLRDRGRRRWRRRRDRHHRRSIQPSGP